ncbi:5-formyltetrahydrofolate cyclo-ligase [Anatilimnocola sp. NA78]|uniref:5-formyltetrahydrofolate cyclo-ligase n=1 Tax=Anatilimnocola sp. NA78 TaxID=3415683 RepID=UPI003CE4AD5D
MSGIELTPKQLFRELARARRAAVDQRAERSAAICQRLMTFPLWAAANTVSIYVDFRDEVQTRLLLDAAWASGKQVTVPFCKPDKTLGMFALASLGELQPGKFGILEPPRPLQKDPLRLISPPQHDLLVTPGLAFDHACQRMGYGVGHYDRLIPLLRADCLKIGLAFDAQVVEHLPTEPHDAPLDLIVAETATYSRDGQG